MTTDSFKKRFLPFSTMLLRVALQMLGNRCEAEDAVQSVYMKLWERRSLITDCGKDEALCVIILKNIIRDRWHSMHTRCESEEPPPDIVDESVFDNLEYADTRQYINAIIERLPQKQKEVMRLKIQGCTYEEIEDLTGLSAVNIRTIISRVRKLIRKHYNEYLEN